MKDQGFRIMTITAAMLVGAVMALVFGSVQGARAQNTLRLAIPADPIMNPVIGTDAAAVPLNRFLYDFLTRPEPGTLKPKPGIALEWSASSDGLNWTFKLARTARWHDGTPFSADDVKYTYDVILDKDQNSPRRSAISVIKNVVVVNKNTVRFELSEPLSSFPTVASYNVGILPRHLLQGQMHAKATEFNTKKPISTGPYRIVDAVPGDHYTFEATGQYFGKEPAIARVVFKVIPDVNTQVAQLRSGELDFVVVQPTNISAVEGVSGIKIEKVPFMGFDHVSFNYAHPLFHDARVRKALIMALDRQSILDNILQGYGTLGTSAIPPLFSWAHNDQLKPYPYDPKRAQAMLGEAGWRKGNDGVLRNSEGKVFEFELGVDKGNPTRERIALVSQQAFAGLGMKVNLKVVEWPVYVKQLISKKWDAHVGFWVLPPDPELTNYYGKDQFFNTVNYDNQKVNELLRRGRQVVDLDQRAKMYKEMQALMYDDPPGAFLYYPFDIQAMRANLTTVQLPLREALQWRELWSFGN